MDAMLGREERRAGAMLERSKKGWKRGAILGRASGRHVGKGTTAVAREPRRHLVSRRRGASACAAILRRSVRPVSLAPPEVAGGARRCPASPDPTRCEEILP